MSRPVLGLPVVPKHDAIMFDVASEEAMEPIVTPVTRLASFRLHSATPMTFELDTDDPPPGVWSDGSAFGFIMDHVHDYERLPVPSAREPGFLPDAKMLDAGEVAEALLMACMGDNPQKLGVMLVGLVNRTVSRNTVQMLAQIVGIIGVWVWLHAHRRWLRLKPSKASYPHTFPSELPVHLFGMREFGDAKWNRKIPIAPFADTCAEHGFNPAKIARDMSVGRFVAVVLQAFEHVIRPACTGADATVFPPQDKYGKAVIKAAEQQLSRHLLIIMAKSGSRRSHFRQGPLAHSFARFVVDMQSSARRPRTSPTPPLSFVVRQSVMPSIGTHVPVIRRSRYQIREDSIPLALAHMWLRPDFYPLEIDNGSDLPAQDNIERMCWQIQWLLPPMRAEDVRVNWQRTERKRLGIPTAVIPLVASLGISLLPMHMYRLSLHALRYAWSIDGIPSLVPPIAVVAWQAMVPKDLMPGVFREDNLCNYPDPFWHWVELVGINRFSVVPNDALRSPLAMGHLLATSPFVIRERVSPTASRAKRVLGKGMRMPALPAVLTQAAHRRNAYATVVLRMPGVGAGVGNAYDLVYKVGGPGTADEWRTWASKLTQLMVTSCRSLELLSHLRTCPVEIIVPDCLASMAAVYWPGAPVAVTLKREIHAVEAAQERVVSDSLVKTMGGERELMKLLVALRMAGRGRHWSGGADTAPEISYMASHVLSFAFIARELGRVGITTDVFQVPALHPMTMSREVQKALVSSTGSFLETMEFDTDDEEDDDDEFMEVVAAPSPPASESKLHAVPQWDHKANVAVEVAHNPCRIVNAWLTKVSRCMIKGDQPGDCPASLQLLRFSMRDPDRTGIRIDSVQREWTRQITGKLTLLVRAIRFGVLPTMSIMLHANASEWHEASMTMYPDAIVRAHDDYVHAVIRRLMASEVSQVFVSAAKSADTTLRLAPESRRLLTGLIAVLPPETEDDVISALTALAAPHAGRLEMDDLVADVEDAMSPEVGRTRRIKSDPSQPNKRQCLWQL